MAVVHSPQDLIPPPSKGAVRPQKIWIWLGLALAALLLTLLYYAPGLTTAGRRSTLATSSLVGLVTAQTATPTDTQFYGDWAAADAQLHQRKLPLWLNDNANPPSPQFLLARTEAPIFYPFSLVYYLASPAWKILLFGAVHFWLLVWAGLLSLRHIWLLDIKNKRSWLLLAALFLLLGTGWAGSGRPDFLAAVSWGVVGLAIILSGRRVWQLLWLTLAMGLALLASMVWGVWLGVVLIILALALELSQQSLGRLLGLAGSLLLVLIGAAGLAGPQLGPHLAYAWQLEQVSYASGKLPLSLELGAYAAFLACMSVAIGMGVLAWTVFYHPEDDERVVRRVAKNSVTPLLAQLVGKIIDVGFSIFTLRLLGPDGNGAYGIAVTTWVFLSTLSEFGLETLTTRDIARDRSQANANRYFSTVFITRCLLSLLALPLAILIIGGLNLSGNLTAASGWAIVVLALGLVPAGLSGCLSAVFRAYEKFEYTAALQIFTAIFKVPLGLALLLIWGVVGLATSALLVNLVTLALLYTIFRRKLFVPHLEKFDWGLARRMLREAYPLMLNGFLINVFFQSDVYLLLPFKGETQVGWYNAAYKFINGLLIIPSTLTLALFPLFSSYGTDAKANLTRAYREALRILVAIALPISVGTLFVAYDIIGAVSGKDYLPHTAIALQILIWFLPFSYVNGVTQYVLIALNRQRTITIAVIGSVITNVGLNLIFIPFFGYQAASVMTIVSEIALLVPFSFIIKSSLGTLPLLDVVWRPLIAASAMGLALALLTLGLHVQNFVLTAIVGAVVYPAVLIIVRGFTREDLGMLKKALRR